MSKTYRIYQIDAFTKTRFSGNPAGVVPNADGLSTKQMQQIARELNNSETAFIFSENLTDCDLHVRFFTPTIEVPICGHATVSAHYVNALEKGFVGHTRIMQKTGVGILPVDIHEQNGDYRIVMTQGDITISEPLLPEIQSNIMQALGLDMSQLIPNIPIALASTGHSKVMVGIQNIDKLHTLNPNFNKLSNISKEINCNGYYVFTLHPEQKILVHGRMFAPAIGILEDPVTGNANGPLGAYLVHIGYADRSKDCFVFEALQGEAISRAGNISVEVDILDQKPAKVRISGMATIAFKTEITI